MARRFIKDEDGLQLTTHVENRQMAFQIAETIQLDLGVEAIVIKARDPETGGEAVSIYLSGGKNDICEDTVSKALKIWRDFI